MCFGTEYFNCKLELSRYEIKIYEKCGKLVKELSTKKYFCVEADNYDIYMYYIYGRKEITWNDKIIPADEYWVSPFLRSYKVKGVMYNTCIYIMYNKHRYIAFIRNDQWKIIHAIYDVKLIVVNKSRFILVGPQQVKKNIWNTSNDSTKVRSLHWHLWVATN